MKKIALLCFYVLTTIFSAHGQRIEKSYVPAYVINSKTLERVAKEVQLNARSFEVDLFLLDYPVLEDLSEYIKSHKYCMIKNTLIKHVVIKNVRSFPYFFNKKDEMFVFYLTNGQKYKVKKKNQKIVQL